MPTSCIHGDTWKHVHVIGLHVIIRLKAQFCWWRSQSSSVMSVCVWRKVGLVTPVSILDFQEGQKCCLVVIVQLLWFWWAIEADVSWWDDLWLTWQEWQVMKQLPVETPLENAFQFHSIFACPVSREQSTAENPPMLMNCGHVLCKQSIQKLVKGNSRTFKCPYCPLETTSAQCRQIYFWWQKVVCVLFGGLLVSCG